MLGLHNGAQHRGDVPPRRRHAGDGAHVLRAGEHGRGQHVADQGGEQQAAGAGPGVVRLFRDHERGHDQAVRRHALVTPHEVERVVAMGVVRARREHEDLVAHRPALVGERMEILALGIEEHGRPLPKVAVRQHEAGALAGSRGADHQDMGRLVRANGRSVHGAEHDALLARQPLLGGLDQRAEARRPERHLLAVDEGEQRAAAAERHHGAGRDPGPGQRLGPSGREEQPGPEMLPGDQEETRRSVGVLHA